MDRLRILLAGVGGQGTLTATTLLARIALDEGVQVTSGEIHGMAQRGGVVESTVLLGGYLSPRIDYAEADIVLGFEPLETLRALPYMHSRTWVFSNQDSLPPPGVAFGREAYPGLEQIEGAIRDCTSNLVFVPCFQLARQAGNMLAANTVLLGALFASSILPFAPSTLERGICSALKPSIVEANLSAARAGAAALPEGL